MKLSRENDELTVREQAASWLCELADDGSDRRAAFTAWLRESPRHVEEFLLTTALWKDLDQVGPSTAVQVQQTIDDILSNVTAADVVALRGGSAPQPSVSSTGAEMRTPSRRPARGMWAAAAVATLFIAAGGLVNLPQWLKARTHTYATTVGEQRALRLEDGSVVYLNTRSRMQVRFSAQARHIRLLEGEALFAVRADPGRPFSVSAGDSVIEAIGTQFVVYRRPEQVRVSVLEGAVKVGQGGSARNLRAGERADLVSDGRVARLAAVDVDTATAWRERRLVFRAAPLAEIAEEFARYGPKRIVVQGEAARHRRLTASFAADDPQSLIQFLRKLEDLSVQTTDEGYVIRAR